MAALLKSTLIPPNCVPQNRPAPDSQQAGSDGMAVLKPSFPRGANRLNGGFCGVNLEIAPDDQSSLSREG
jgi:hypothetical protein